MPENGHIHHESTNGIDLNSYESVDAVHIRFREKGPTKNYQCYNCDEYFTASSILDVFEHYARIRHVQYHSDCLYCQGRVYSYRNEENERQYYHNCNRWRRQEDK